MEPNSFSPYFAFYSNGWYQCFMDDVYSLGEKYDIVNRRDLGGIGIWALGYDNGRQELWDLIASKFTQAAEAVNADTLFDSGGPSFDYYDNEDYSYTIRTRPGTSIYLSFSYLDTEANYDTLWVYDGPDTTFPLVGTFSGNEVPSLIQSTTNGLTLCFRSDAATTDAGWRAVYDTVPVSGMPKQPAFKALSIRPNPADRSCSIQLPVVQRPTTFKLFIFDATGRVTLNARPINGKEGYEVDTSRMPSGVFTVIVHAGSSVWAGKLLIRH
jgi:hypothetical protein